MKEITWRHIQFADEIELEIYGGILGFPRKKPVLWFREDINVYRDRLKKSLQVICDHKETEGIMVSGQWDGYRCKRCNIETAN